MNSAQGVGTGLYSTCILPFYFHIETPLPHHQSLAKQDVIGTGPYPIYILLHFETPPWPSSPILALLQNSMVTTPFHGHRYIHLSQSLHSPHISRSRTGE